MEYCISLNNVNLQLTKDVITCITSISAILIALYGLHTWKRQLKGGNQYTIAKNLIVATMEIKGYITFLRAPTLLNVKYEDTNVTATQELTYTNMVNKIAKKQSEIHGFLLESKLFWGAESSDSFEKLNTITSEFITAMLMRPMYNKILKDANLSDIAAVNQIESYKQLWKLLNGSSNDDFGKSLDAAVRDVEVFFLPKMK